MELDIGGKKLFGCNENENFTKVVISDGVEEICEGAFAECKNLKEVIIPEGVKIIGKRAFFNCIQLKNVIIPGSVKKIGDEAFSNCASLESVIIQEGVEEIEGDPFQWCISLRHVTIPKSLKVISGDVFNTCFKLFSITIGEGIFDKLIRKIKLKTIPCCIKNHYTSKIHYSEKDIDNFKNFKKLKENRDYYLECIFLHERYRDLLYYKELLHFMLFDMVGTISYEEACDLLDITEDKEIMIDLLEYTNIVRDNTQLEKFDLGNFGDEGIKGNKL